MKMFIREIFLLVKNGGDILKTLAFFPQRAVEGGKLGKKSKLLRIHLFGMFRHLSLCYSAAAPKMLQILQQC